MALNDRETGEEIISINWLRNPFGLCQWAEDNADPKIDFTLWFVCNEWSYDKSAKINRPMFKAVVDAYGEKVRSLNAGYFWFPVDRWPQTIEQMKSGALPSPRNSDGWILEHPLKNPNCVLRDAKIGIPQEWFSCTYRPHPLRWAWDASLDAYRTWFGQLESLAEQLQDEQYEFYCST